MEEDPKQPHRIKINIGADNEKMNLGNVSNFSAREYVMSAGATMSTKVKRILSEEDCIEIGKRTNVFQQTHFWLKHMTPFNLKLNN